MYIRRSINALLALVSIFAMAGLSACGFSGAGDGSSSNGTTAEVTSGTIIGFGSVIVNGIEFTRKGGLADDRVKLRFDNITSASESSLRVGMNVKVRGHFNTATGTGEYESIEFQPDVRGPLDTNGVDTATSTITVMGRKVQVEATTNFDGIRDITEINGELQLGNHPELEISGTLDDAGLLHATRIARKAINFDTLSSKVVQTKGTISSATSGSFTVGNFTVNYDQAALGQNTVIGDIAAGTLVEVNGILNGNVIIATRIDKQVAVEAAVNDSVFVKGTAAGGITNNTFILNGLNGAITVNTASAIFQVNNAVVTSAIVSAGTSLEVEGKLQSDGSIAATRINNNIKTPKTVRIEGNVGSKAVVFNSPVLTLNGVPINISSTTRLLDRNAQVLDLLTLKSGDHLQVAGLLDVVTGKVIASQVERTSSSNIVLLQGPVSIASSSTLTLMGLITVDTSAVLASDFKDNRTGTRTAFAGKDAFFNAITNDGLTIVMALGSITGTTMKATEVEMEPPQ